MTSTAEAITTIRSFTEEQGVPMELAEVLVTEQVGLAGTGFDVEQRIHVPEVDERIVKDGVLTGVFACRAVIINPAESKIFINRPNVEDVTLIRARLTYDQLPSDLSEGGEVSHTAIYTLTGTDTKDIDEYYTASDSYATASRKRFEELSERFGGRWQPGDDEFINPDPGEEPQMPYMHVRYDLKSPNVRRLPDDDSDGMMLLGRFSVRSDLQRAAIHLVQQKYPETSILSSTNHGRISREELPLLATWLVNQSAQ